MTVVTLTPQMSLRNGAKQGAPFFGWREGAGFIGIPSKKSSALKTQTVNSFQLSDVSTGNTRPYSQCQFSIGGIEWHDFPLRAWTY
jgi:hypothetical protein